MFLQNKEAAAEWPVSPEVLEELQAAMAKALPPSTPTIAAYEKKMHKRARQQKRQNPPTLAAAEGRERS